MGFARRQTEIAQVFVFVKVVCTYIRSHQLTPRTPQLTSSSFPLDYLANTQTVPGLILRIYTKIELVFFPFH